MSKKSLPKVTHSGTTDINGFKIKCFNLDNGERVLSREGFLRALGRMGNPKYKESEAGTQLFLTPVFLRAINLKPFISNELINSSQPIEFEFMGKRVYGYKAEILPLVCYVYTDAEKEKKLTPAQEIVAERCHSLIRGFAVTGIIALVDEATGFQDVREKDALRKFLEKFLLAEQGKWIKTFPDDFFEMIFKMKGWNWDMANKGKKPSVVGHYINNFVYSRLAPDVLKELRKLNPVTEKGHRKYKYPQFIEPDFGHPLLKEHLASLTALGRASGYNWKNFQRLLNRAFPKFGSTPELGFPNDGGEILD